MTSCGLAGGEGDFSGVISSGGAVGGAKNVLSISARKGFMKHCDFESRQTPCWLCINININNQSPSADH